MSADDDDADKTVTHQANFYPAAASPMPLVDIMFTDAPPSVDVAVVACTLEVCSHFGQHEQIYETKYYLNDSHLFHEGKNIVLATSYLVFVIQASS